MVRNTRFGEKERQGWATLCCVIPWPSTDFSVLPLTFPCLICRALQGCWEPRQATFRARPPHCAHLLPDVSHVLLPLLPSPTLESQLHEVSGCV